MSLEKMDALFGITDDLLAIMEESQRGRAASQMASSSAAATAVDAPAESLFTVVGTASGEQPFEHKSEAGCRSRNASPVYHV